MGVLLGRTVQPLLVADIKDVNGQYQHAADAVGARARRQRSQYQDHANHSMALTLIRAPSAASGQLAFHFEPVRISATRKLSPDGGVI